MPDDVQVESLAEARQHIASLSTRVGELEQAVSDFRQKFDTLETPLLRRIKFRVQGWPGQRDLNADRPAPRPWHRWWKP